MSTDDSDSKRVIVDTDTAGDDTQAILMAALSDRLDLDALTICAGNVEFDYQVENAKYTLDLIDAADDVPVYEGATAPLQKEHDFADYVHGEGGLGGELFPDTGIESGDEHAVDYIVRTARENPGELSLLCIAPLTNVALALQREPELNELLDEVWIMGGAANTVGNVTPAAEYNFWVDPDAAKIVVRNLDVTLVDWGLTVRDSYFGPETLAEIEDGPDSRLAEFYLEVTRQVRAFNEDALGEDATTQPDSLTVAGLIEPDLIEAADTYHVDVDEREGLTRGYSAVDEVGVTDGEPRTRVVESVDAELFERMFLDMLFEENPEASL